MCIAYKMLNTAQLKRIQMHSKPSALHSIETKSIVFEKKMHVSMQHNNSADVRFTAVHKLQISF